MSGIIIFISTIGFVLSENNFKTFQKQNIDENYLETLRKAASLECLKNSHCLENYECLSNKCIESNQLTFCQDVKLSIPITDLKIGSPINADKRVLTRTELPYFLSDGELVEIIDKKVVEYLYSPVILVGDSKINLENQDYLIKTSYNSTHNETLYSYKMFFSKGIDFSNKNLQGQILRVLGDEYVIGDDSKSSNIFLISHEKKIELQDQKNLIVNSEVISGTHINLNKNSKGDISEFEIIFNNRGEDKEIIRYGEKYTAQALDRIELHFDNANFTEIPDISIGGRCE